MPAKTRIILLEFNELTPELTDRFIAEGHLPNFRRFREESQTFVSDAEAQPPFLEPWIQWVTVHSGLTYQEHGLVHLDEGHKLATKRVWDLLSDAGYNVWVCGSMNAGCEADLRGGFVPDPWCTEVKPKPDELGFYFKFVQQNVLEYTNSKVPLTKADYMRFVSFMATHGLSWSTVSSIVGQLYSERNGHNRWKRATLLDALQFDLFSAYYRKFRPDFSTFFLNSTAHYQHSYWRTMAPELFSVKASADEQREYESAILYGYQKMDEALGRFMTLAGQDATLIFCTALSQQACLKYEEQGGASFYRPTDFAALARFMNLSNGYKVAPVMTHQFHLEFDTDAHAEDAEKTLQSLQVSGVDALQVERTGCRIFTGCGVYRTIPDTARLSLRGSDKSVPFYDIFYKLDTMKSGMHHPDGMLWIRTPQRVHRESIDRVPLAAVAPTILNMFGLGKPPYMKSDPLPVLQ